MTLSTIDQMIARGEQRRLEKKAIQEHPTDRDYQNAWQMFLAKAGSYLPVEVRKYLRINDDLMPFPRRMPPQFISEYDDFRLSYRGLAPIKVHFSASQHLITYEVINFDCSCQCWDWSNAKTFNDLELALGEASHQYKISQSLIL